MTADKLLVVENFVNGKFSTTPAKIPSFNPATGKVWAHIPDSGFNEVDEAVSAAMSAFPAWSSLEPSCRASYLYRIAELFEARIEEFAFAESADQGKPVSLARKVDIPRVAHNFRTFATAWQHKLETANTMESGGVINMTCRSPVGVAGLISPWNLPLYLLSFKIAPAIMAGNTVVCKPSELTSVTAWMMAKIFQEAQLPPGVVNIVFGYGNICGEAIVRHPEVRIVSFTGSTAVGQHIASIASPMMKKVSLELGGKNAAIVFKDADLEKCIEGVVRSSFINQGEVCLCTSRIFVQQEIYNEFLIKFVERTKQLKTGDPMDDSNFLGAMNSKGHYDKVTSYIKIAEEEGGKILTGDRVTRLQVPTQNQGGWFIQPTIIVNLPDTSRCMQEEIFGPVVCVSPFTTEEEVTYRVNNTRYGLCASVWSQNLGIVHRMSQKLQVGTVWTNCWLLRCLDMPFGGCKDSGTGKEGTTHSLDLFTEEKTICIKIS